MHIYWYNGCNEVLTHVTILLAGIYASHFNVPQSDHADCLVIIVYVTTILIISSTTHFKHNGCRKTNNF